MVTGIEKRFGGITALAGVSFSVAAGEILGVLGPNGAGKTTLFDVLSGFETADAGTVTLRVGGQARDLTHLPPQTRAHLGLGRTFQDGRLFPALTVQETIAVAFDHAVEVRDPVAAALNLPVVADSEVALTARVDETVTMLGLEAFRDKFVHELSTGYAPHRRPRVRDRAARRRCCCSTNRRAGSPNARPRRSRRSSSASATSSGPASS